MTPNQPKSALSAVLGLAGVTAIAATIVVLLALSVKKIREDKPKAAAPVEAPPATNAVPEVKVKSYFVAYMVNHSETREKLFEGYAIQQLGYTAGHEADIPSVVKIVENLKSLNTDWTNHVIVLTSLSRID